ncbi:hypothetical protein [Scatolibacter rhodanostii]|uniref:hypothetical protein n=1 Tax=Scatolibacter rhodanostii TaxID=2014781 RepID=UPI00190E68B2|nr:hypothetical protein [Scatolibacter rhodanostii]
MKNESNNIKSTADEKNSHKGISAELTKSRLVNQNQSHHVKKEALGPNTKQ